MVEWHRRLPGQDPAMLARDLRENGFAWVMLDPDRSKCGMLYAATV